MIRKHFDRILIVSGLIIVIIAISLKINTQWEQKHLISNYRKSMKNMEEQDREYNLSDGSKPNDELQESNNQVQPTIKSNDNNTLQKASIKSGDMIGILSISKINLSVAIGEGIENDTLKYSVGHFTNTAMPGEEGNVCIVGHRSYSYGEFFNRLDELEKDDEIIIESNGSTYKYVVTDCYVVEPEEVSVLEQTKDAEITLITCTPIRIATHRLIIKGILIVN